MTRDIEDMTDAQDEAPERIWASSNRRRQWAGCGGWRIGRNPDDQAAGFPDAEYVRADLARAKIDRLAETCGYAISQWEDWVRDQLEGTSGFSPAIAEIETTRAAVRADLARPSQVGDERVARLRDVACGATTTIAHALDDGQIDEEVVGNFEALLTELNEAIAALAAMDTPKGGGDE